MVSINRVTIHRLNLVRVRFVFVWRSPFEMKLTSQTFVKDLNTCGTFDRTVQWTSSPHHFFIARFETRWVQGSKSNQVRTDLVRRQRLTLCTNYVSLLPLAPLRTTYLASGRQTRNTAGTRATGGVMAAHASVSACSRAGVSH